MNRQFEGTPGPWEVTTEPTKCYGPMLYVKQQDTSQGITDAVFPTRHGEANARAIAAVPDMIEALQSALEDMEDMEEMHCETIARIKAALNKALGEGD